MKTILDQWVADDAPLLDADDDGEYDHPGAAIYPAVLLPLLVAAVDPVLGDVPTDDDVEFYGISGASLVDKDLRTVLGDDVEGPFALSYCGAGDLATCRGELWAALAEATDELADEYGDDTSSWLVEGARSTFAPGLIPDDFRATNRPTFQQVIEFANS